MKGHILVIDDEERICTSLKGILNDEGYEVSMAFDGPSGLHAAQESGPDLVLLDIWMPGMDGLEVLTILKERYPYLPVVIISGHGNVETAVKATRLGAFDFVEKPLDMDKILLTARNALQIGRLAEENLQLRARNQRPQLSGNSPAIQAVRQSISAVAPTDAWVLITGENGTGKELVAHAIHRQSRRSGKPFVDINCAAIPEELIESELFGHERGAFTGAESKKRGKFDLAHKGTLFLDEIGDMSLKTQAKILRILQEQRFERVGGTKTIKVDARVVAATNKDLQDEITAGRFREDLFYRLNVVPIVVPPLRERQEDIPQLVKEFLSRVAGKFHVEPKSISGDALGLLCAQPWPGNVRELKNLIERLVILTPGQEIQLDDLPVEMDGRPLKNSGFKQIYSGLDFKSARMEFEKQYLEHKLIECEGNISQTAEAVGLERSHLHKKIKALGIKSMRNGD
jgi:two-component system nitrogen regulation response regulator NtrX